MNNPTNQNNEDNFSDQYRERLKKILSKKFETVTIFPLSSFEAAFGHLWSHGLEESELTPEQRVFRAKWQQCRNNILNNGNHQKRNAMRELDMHKVEWLRYQATFIPVNRQPLDDQENKNN